MEDRNRGGKKRRGGDFGCREEEKERETGLLVAVGKGEPELSIFLGRE